MKGKPIQVLLVEDNAGDARLFREMFRNEKPGIFELTHLMRLSDAEAHLAKSEVDIVLLDMGLPDGHGLDTVRRARKAAPLIPLIVLTGLDDEAIAAEAMKEGAEDYLIKGQIENRALPRALRHAIERHRLQAENDLVLTRQLQFKDEFLSHVSHELRSPLTAIYQFVTILLDGLAGEANPEQREYLAIVLRNVKQLQSMINDLLEVTHLQSGKPMIEAQSTSLSEAVDYAIETLAGAALAKGVALASEIEDLLPFVCADPMRVRQILVILLDNAIKFTPPNGTVTIKARALEESKHAVAVEVSDTGCGIDPEMVERIFERMFQAVDPASAGRQGLGLGLHICRELVTRQGGQISVRSTPGKGSNFSFSLPVFSLAVMIAPAIRRKRQTEGPVTLVVADVRAKTGWASDEARTEHSSRIRSLLQDCLYSNRDVLLPKMSASGIAELFFIVAVTDKIGGEAITKRIREKWEGGELFQQEGLTLSASYKSLESIKRGDTESMDAFLEKVATEMQALLSSEISLRMVSNGK